MIKAFLAGLIFWALTLLFPAITISGFWTIAGVIIVGTVINIVYQFTIGLLLTPFRILTLGFLEIVINTGIVYLMSEVFNEFTIEPGNFWQVLLFTTIYMFATRTLYSKSNEKK